MKKSTLKKYAYAIAKIGANVQKGQDVFIHIQVNQADFAKELMEACYKLGAKFVHIIWDHDETTMLRVNKEKLDSLSEFRPFEKEMLEYRLEHLPASIFIDSADPDGLKKMNQEKSAKMRQARYKFIKPYHDKMDCRYQWVIAGMPSYAWAKKVFPHLSKKEAYKKLEAAILYVTRINDDPVKAWEEHNKNLTTKMNYLNSLNLDYLHYTSSNGTDFKVWLMEKSIWLSGKEETLESKIVFNPNMPTEEVFTTPKAGKAEGIVYASKPLSYDGALIENFWFRFKDGKVVECYAEKNNDLLQKMVSMDEGASKLGEVALVPYESPINQTGILFYNTLFDENAACHLALGMGFINCVKDFSKYTLEELTALGVNQSMNHVDFMIGTRDLNIDGYTKDGKKIPIFKNGTWVS